MFQTEKEAEKNESVLRNDLKADQRNVTVISWFKGGRAISLGER